MKTAIPLVPAATHEAWAALLIGVLTAQQPVPCVGAQAALWTSSAQGDRSKAAEQCKRCPVLDLCAQYADAAGESWHVFGGRDRQTQPDLSDGPLRKRSHHRRKEPPK